MCGSGRVRIFLCGDVMTGRGVDQALPHPSDPQLYESWIGSALDYVALAERRNGPIPRPVAFDYPWGAALGEWARRRPDLRIVNLETSVTTSDDHAPKGINYRMHPRNAASLTAAGIDCCVLANNHIGDWGQAGLLETLDVVAGQGIATAGAGRTSAQAAAPVVLPVADRGRVLVCAFCTTSSGVPADWAAGAEHPGVNLIAPSPGVAERLAAQLAQVRRAGDIVVASIHWGPNWGYEIPQAHQRFAHALIDVAGVSIVHGHSSHHPLAIEVHNGGLILYGCGDFLTDYEGISGHEAYRPDLALMYFVDVDAQTGQVAAVEMAPLQMRRFQLATPDASDAAWLQNRLGRECARVGATVRRAGGGLTLSWPRAVQTALRVPR
ncbi:CapA family protein [Phenylobacterium sp. LjRoot219]|uniref:CapA family protein n=1 Tax=Phenylobacterium sp. LjRoot219 TaxID=3342283 RepID=UPI003ED0F8A6